MSPVSGGIYNPYRLNPIVKIKQNLAIWSLGKWSYYVCQYQNPLAAGGAMRVDMVAASGATSIAANGTVAKRVVNILQLNEYEFLHGRFEPLDNVEGLIWELSGQQANASRNIHSRVDQLTRNWDPDLVSSTFFVLGQNRDMNLEVRNPLGYALPQARFQFWGCRMIVEPHPKAAEVRDIKTKNLLDSGDTDTVKQIIGEVTYVPAEGRL